MNLKTFLVSLLTVISFSGCVSQNMLNIYSMAYGWFT